MSVAASALAVLLLLIAACTANYPPSRLPAAAAASSSGAFVMSDGTSLPYREWLPAAPPGIVILAFHGFNDSYDAWERPAPTLVHAGIAVIAPDQRGFGGTADRGRWAGTAEMTSDAAQMAGVVRRRFPRARLYLMGESMGAAMLMCLAASADAPAVDGYVLISPAVWGWSQMNLFLRASLWITNGLAPALRLDNGPIAVQASDNRDALIRLSQDPRTLSRSRVAAVKGLVDLMDQALHTAPALHAPTLIMFGGNDQLIPKHAMRAAWRSLPSSPLIRLAYYPSGYHLLLRDHDAARRLADLTTWLRAPAMPLPSAADTDARRWLNNPSAPAQSTLEATHRTRSSAG